MINREILQFILIGFLLHGLYTVWVRFRAKKIVFFGYLFWTLLFLSGIIGISFPDLTVFIASQMGIGRGTDFVVYASIVLLFYLIFRLYSLVEDLRLQIVVLIREIALNNRIKTKKKA